VDDPDNACPSGYDRTAMIAYDFNDLYDFNQNDYICLYVNKKYT
jgi:phenylalanyl-tRNA synthetase alpha subunit